MEAGPDTDAQTSSHLASDLQASPCRSCFASVSSTSMMGVPGDQLSLIQLPLTSFSTPCGTLAPAPLLHLLVGVGV